MAIQEFDTRNQPGDFQSLDGISITRKGAKIMSNDRNEALVQESSFAFCAERFAKSFTRRQFLIASAGGIAATIAAPSLAFAAQNPVINQSGTASINAGQNCTWTTANGKNSTISIGNSSRANNLTIAITGAPGSGIIVQVGDRMQTTLNGIFTLPPNSPTYVVVATGNFAGATLTIVNITNKQNDASANIHCATS